MPHLSSAQPSELAHLLEARREELRWRWLARVRARGAERAVLEGVLAAGTREAVRHHGAARKQGLLGGEEERFQLLVEGVSDYALFLLDPEGRVATWNLGAERIKGWRAEEVLGQSLHRFYPPEDVAAGVPEMVLFRAATEGRCRMEGLRVRKDGTRF